MVLLNRLSRLERTTLTADGVLRCRRCKDGTAHTCMVVTMCGVEEPGSRRPCPDCGRENPMFINIMEAKPPNRPAPETPA